MNTTKKNILFRTQITLASLLALGSLSLSAAHAQGISVTVDGEVIPFVGQAPIEQAGSVLVPLRGVFEKLGATVGYDAGSKTILAVKGQTAISLKLGDMSAQVNGVTRTLSSPARAINGTTLVPLRFVSEALGAQVKWSGPSRTVIIATNGAPQPEQPQPPIVDNEGPALKNLSPAPGSSVAPGKPLISGTFADDIVKKRTRLIVNGEDVTDAATITDAFFSYKPVTNLPSGKSTVTVITQDAAGNKSRKDWSFMIGRGDSSNVIRSLTFSPDSGTLQSGDVITVSFVAKPGGVAKFNIGGEVTRQPMREVSAGVYRGTYTVRRGDSVSDAPIMVAFTYGGRTVTQVASKSISIAAR